MTRFTFRALAAAAFWAATACSPTLETSCKSDEDCPAGERCAALHCVAGNSADAERGGEGGGGGLARADAASGGADQGRTADARPAGDASTVTDAGAVTDVQGFQKPDADRAGGGSGGTGGSGGSGGSGAGWRYGRSDEDHATGLNSASSAQAVGITRGSVTTS